jgi:hypothetical protein
MPTTRSREEKNAADSLNSPKPVEPVDLLPKQPHSSKSNNRLVARREKVWDAHIIERKSIRDIAREEKISPTTVVADLKWVTNIRLKSLIEKDKSVVAKQDTIYDALLDRWLPVALDPDRPPDVAMYATDRVTRILVDRGKMHGFGMPTKDARADGAVKEIGLAALQAMTRLASGKHNVPDSVIDAEVVQSQIEDKPDASPEEKR